MQAKALEIRDRATFIPALAIDMNPKALSAEDENWAEQRYLLRRAGYACDGKPIIVLTYMHAKDKAFYNPFDWPENPRTMRAAHIYIQENWRKLKDGDVIDVEFILGEKTEKKISERFESF